MKGNNRKRELEAECKSEGDHGVMDNQDRKEVGSMNKGGQKNEKKDISFGCIVRDCSWMWMYGKI